tara:strand:- start:28697 stop:29005 length:309 start_codon:yes stop_codon:yes gene_type:complete
MKTDVQQLLQKIANGYNKQGSNFSNKIFTREELQKYKLFKSMTMDYLIVKTKDGNAAKIGQLVGTKNGRAHMIDAKFYQSGSFGQHFKLIDRLVKRGKGETL